MSKQKIKYDVVVIGAGVTGLMATYELAKKGKKVLVLEQSNKIGGLLNSYKISNYNIEAFYHHIFPYNKYLLNLLSELDLKNRILWKQTSTGFYNKGKIYKLVGFKDLLKFKLLNLTDKLYFIKLMLIIKLYKDVNKLDNITAKDWIIKNSNIRVWNNLFKQLLISKFGNNCDKISATWFVDMVRIRSNRGLRGEKLGYIKGGFQYFIESLVSRMEEFNVTILKNIKIKKIKLKNKKVEFIVTRDKEIFADNFISTIPINSLINYFNLQKNYKNEFKELNYQGAICVLLGLKKNLTNNFYWVNIIDEKSPFGAYIEHTNFVRDGYRDCNIVYLASYPDYEKKIWKMNDKDIFKLYFNYLKSMFNKLHYKDVIWWKVSKGKYAGLVYKKGILSYLPNFKFLDNLYIGGLFNARHSGLDEAVKIGHTLANFVLK